MRVLQAPLNIANQGWLNAESLRMRGHHAEIWQLGERRFGYPADRVILDANEPAVMVETLLDAMHAGFDVVHFHFAQSLVPATGAVPWLWDLPLWRALGTRVVFSFHGTDIRIARVAKELDPWSAYHFADIPCDEDRIGDVLAVIREYADAATISNVANRVYFPEAHYLPLSVDLRAIPEVPLPMRDVPVVAHAPSMRGTKGTEFVLAGLESLRREGVAFELDLIEGVSNAEVVQRYADADVVVEKLVNEGFGVAALEAMAIGRPVVSRVVDAVFAAHPDLPIIVATPESFVDVLRPLLVDPERRVAPAAAGRPYVEAAHDITLTGARLEDLYAMPRTTPTGPYPGWTVPARSRRISELQALLNERRADEARMLERLVEQGRQIARLEQELETARRAGPPADGGDERPARRARRWRGEPG